MKKSKLKNIDVKVSSLCLGTHNFFSQKLKNENDIKKILDLSLENNINFFDTADSYTNGKVERLLGNYFKFNSYKDKVVIATKIGPLIDFNPKFLQKSIDDSLRRLKVDCLDICYFHSGENKHFFNEDYWNILNKNLKNKIKALGLSIKSSLIHNDDIKQIEYCDNYNVSVINLLYNPLFPHAEKFFNKIKKKKLDLITRVPFAKGALFSYKKNAQDSFTAKDIKKAKSKILKIRKKNISHKILQWVKKNSNCKSIVLGSSSIDQIISNSEYIN